MSVRGARWWVAAAALLWACGGASAEGGDAAGETGEDAIDVADVTMDVGVEAGPDVAPDELLDVPATDEAGPGDLAGEDATGDEADADAATAEAEEVATDPGAEDVKPMEIPVFPCAANGDCTGKLGTVPACFVAACVAETGTCAMRPLPTGTNCDDQDPCTTGDVCRADACHGRARDCDDGNPCTDDSCDAVKGCVNKPNTLPCEDGNPGTTLETCKAGACQGGVNQAGPCPDDPWCKDHYDDGDACDGVLKCVCDVAGCAAGSTAKHCVVDPTTVITCPPTDDTACAARTCDAVTGTCVAAALADGKPCDDGDACTVATACQAGVCAGGTALGCDDGNPCTEDTCVPSVGCVHTTNGAACDDGDACTTGDHCALGLCQPGAPACGSLCKPAMVLFCGASHLGDSGALASTNLATDYSCNKGQKYSGPEFTYEFTAPFDGHVAVGLGDKTGDTDLMVLEAGGGCDPKKCVAWGYNGAGFDAKAGASYYLVVDGFNGSEGLYSLHVDCKPAHELDCANGVDEDGDGKTDCADVADCGASPACAHGGCVPAWALKCGEHDTWGTDRPGATQDVQGYSCNSVDYSGPEYVYTFASSTAQTVRVRLRDKSTMTNIVILKSADGECLSNTCIDYGVSEVTFQAEAGLAYDLVVDGRNGSGGRFTIEVDCM